MLGPAESRLHGPPSLQHVLLGPRLSQVRPRACCDRSRTAPALAVRPHVYCIRSSEEALKLIAGRVGQEHSAFGGQSALWMEVTSQDDEGPMAEPTQTFHVTYRRVIHIDLRSRSRVNRSASRSWSRGYWIWRGQGFIGSSDANPHESDE